ncbi:FAD-binding protein [Methylosinus sp. Ce-a6]|uniref:FAD-binding protein n=1 Tax=Methylosinus sp. Ce-a6 TaxID=2172005 RepID=UPI00135C4779|nr:FAD-binding protein [Methylosinus sp. Ce-a6]
MTHHDHRIAEEARLVEGLVVAEGKSYSNWGGHRSTRPAVYVEPIRYADVQAVVRDVARFPTPVNPAGSLLSVAPAFVNDGGTLVCMRKLDEILGVETDARGRTVVRVQAGCRLKKLNMWLQARRLEIPFQAEIGEATVGSVAVGDTKESSLDAPGYFSAHVVEITYVDEAGALRVISDHADGSAFQEFKCSFGLSGIVVECLVETRPATLCRSDVSIIVYETPAQLSEDLLARRGRCDALLAIVFLDRLACVYDERFQAGPGSVTPESSQPQCEAFRAAKRLAIQRGFDGVEVPQPKGLVYSRADFVNEYWRPERSEKRLDFQYYEHDVSQLARVVEETYAFTGDFARETGFAPNGWAAYFVRRPRAELKPFGLYSGGPGVSFSFDPISSDPDEPRWREFSRRYNELAIRTFGARVSPIQTQWLKKGDVAIPRRLARPRFTTAYFAEFLE